MCNFNKQFLIYKAVNKRNGKVYIGATTRSLDERKKDHIQKALTGTGQYFQEAIGTYAPESFIWEQIDTACSADELAAKEIKYIEQYNSCKNGYNSDKGGGFKKTIYQYNLDGSLHKSHDDLASAAASIGANRKTISKACWNVNHTLGGFYWSYSCTIKFTPQHDDRKKAVFQYDLNDNFVGKYDSVSEAASILKLSKSGISKCCRGERKSSGGYIWKYE